MKKNNQSVVSNQFMPNIAGMDFGGFNNAQ